MSPASVSHHVGHVVFLSRKLDCTSHPSNEHKKCVGLMHFWSHTRKISRLSEVDEEMRGSYPCCLCRINSYHPEHLGAAGFFLTCQDLERRVDLSFLACAASFFLKVEIGSCTLIPLFRPSPCDKCQNITCTGRTECCCCCGCCILSQAR